MLSKAVSLFVSKNEEIHKLTDEILEAVEHLEGLDMDDEFKSNVACMRAFCEVIKNANPMDEAELMRLNNSYSE